MHTSDDHPFLKRANSGGKLIRDNKSEDKIRSFDDTDLLLVKPISSIDRTQHKKEQMDDKINKMSKKRKSKKKKFNALDEGKNYHTINTSILMKENPKQIKDMDRSAIFYKSISGGIPNIILLNSHSNLNQKVDLNNSAPTITSNTNLNNNANNNNVDTNADTSISKPPKKR